jgi:glycosyltransferase involved in cell wall biosynthesis
VRILYFTRDYTTHDRRFLERLGSSGHQIGFLRLENDGRPYELRPLPAGIEQVDWEGGRQPATSFADCFTLMPALERVIERWRPDVVHAGPVQSCGFMAALAGARPLLVMSWGSDLLVDANRDAAHQWVTAFTLRAADGLLCDCDAVRRKVDEFVPSYSGRIIQFPWGVDLDLFAPAADRDSVRRDLGLHDGLIVLSTRLWEDFYGIDTVLESVARAMQRVPGVPLRLVLLGDGSRAAQVREFLAARGLRAVVDTPGIVSHDRLPEYFKAADVYLSCARSDGASISLLEAMASGIPVVVTDSPSNREWVDGLPGGWPAAVDDADAFANGLVHFAEMPADERRRIGARNRQVASERANWPLNVTRLFDAYDQLYAASQSAMSRGGT